MKIFALALGAACMAAIAAPLPAQAQSGTILKSFSTQDLQQAMAAIGGTATLQESTDDGDPAMRLDFANGVVAMAEFNCNDVDGCTGLSLIAYFTRDESTSIAQAQEMTRRFDWARAAVSAGLNDDGNMYVGRYIIFDNGIAYDNLVVNLQVFEALTGEFAGN